MSKGLPSLRKHFIGCKNVVKLDEIPPQLITNWHQTALHYVPLIVDLGGAKRVDLQERMINDNNSGLWLQIFYLSSWYTKEDTILLSQYLKVGISPILPVIGSLSRL